MKKSSLLLALPAVVLSGLLLSGCGIFRSHKAWDTAQQQSPLEIPPGLDRPSTSDALVIPPPGSNDATAEGVRAGVPGSRIADGFVLQDTVDGAYGQVGQVLADTNLGQLASHDDASHSYVFTASDGLMQNKVKKGFFSRIFSFGKGGAPSAAGVSRQVQVSIGSSGEHASEILVQGAPAAVNNLIEVLRSRLKNVKPSAG